MSEHLAIIVMGLDRPDMSRIITELIHSKSCEVESTHMHKCGEEFTMTFLVNGNWNVIAKLEEELDALQEEIDCNIIYKRTKNEPSKIPGIPYIAQVIAPFDSSILNEVITFFTGYEFNIKEVTAYRYIASQTGAEMFNLQMFIELPISTNISDLREEFMSFCEDLNIDATIEPDKI